MEISWKKYFEMLKKWVSWDKTRKEVAFRHQDTEYLVPI